MSHLSPRVDNTSATTTVAPSAENNLASHSPWPRAAPVIRATFPLSLIFHHVFMNDCKYLDILRAVDIRIDVIVAFYLTRRVHVEYKRQNLTSLIFG